LKKNEPGRQLVRTTTGNAWLPTAAEPRLKNTDVDPKQQNRLKVGTDEPKQKVKMWSVSDDDVWKRLLK